MLVEITRKKKENQGIIVFKAVTVIFKSFCLFTLSLLSVFQNFYSKLLGEIRFFI